MKNQVIFRIALVALVCVIYPITVRAQAAPAITVSTKSVDCGSVKTGGSSDPPGTVTIGNTGSGDLIISAIGLSGTNGSEFSQTNNCSIIPAGGSCTAQITFSPLSSGKKTGVLTIASNAARTPLVSVKLKGSSSPPKIASSTKSVKFIPVSIGATSTDVGLTISNAGVSDLTIDSVSLSGVNESEFSRSHNCSTVTAGGSCNISLALTPSSVGKKAALLSIQSNDPKKPLLGIKLSGTASGQVLAGSPAANAVLTTTRPTLSWQQYANATEYHLQVSTSSKFEPAMTREVITSATSFASPLLTAGTSYYWIVYAVTPLGTTSASASRKVTCAAGSTFSPLDGAVSGKSPGEAASIQPTIVPFRNEGGEQVSFIAYPGEVLVRMAEDVPVETATSLVKSSGGIVYAAVPALGYYWAAVEQGTEAEFIQAMYVSPHVLNAAPNQAAQVKQSALLASAIPNFNEWVRNFTPKVPLETGTANLLQFDNFTDPLAICGGVTHGDLVGAIAQKDNVPVTQFDVTYPGGFREGLDFNWLHWAILSAGDAAERSNRKLVLNISLGPDGPNDTVDRHGCSSGIGNPDCDAIDVVEIDTDSIGNDDSVCDPGEPCRYTTYQDYQYSNTHYIESIATTLDFLRREYPEQFKRIGVVVAAGNDGLELSAVTTVRQTYPEAFGNMLVAGGTDQQGARWSGGNSSINTDDMLYAPATTPACPDATGTSASAPMVSNVLARLSADQGTGSLTMGQLVEAMKTAAPLTGIYRNVPTFQAALGVAKTMVPTYTLSIGKTGTGNGTISANPAASSYSAGTTVTLTASPDSNSTFAGWSGGCSGTGACSITMNADTSVTASFAPEVVVPIAGNWKGTYSVTYDVGCGSMTDTGIITLAVTQSVNETGIILDGPATLSNMRLSGYDVDDDGNVICSSLKPGTLRTDFYANDQPDVNWVEGLGAVDNAYNGSVGFGLGFFVEIDGNQMRGIWTNVIGEFSLKKN